VADFYKAIEDRRSIYAISSEAVVSDDRILGIVKHAVKYTPTSFNSQSGRVVILLDEHHTKLWNHNRNITENCTCRKCCFNGRKNTFFWQRLARSCFLKNRMSSDRISSSLNYIRIIFRFGSSSLPECCSWSFG